MTKTGALKLWEKQTRYYLEWPGYNSTQTGTKITLCQRVMGTGVLRRGSLSFCWSQELTLPSCTLVLWKTWETDQLSHSLKHFEVFLCQILEKSWRFIKKQTKTRVYSMEGKKYHNRLKKMEERPLWKQFAVCNVIVLRHFERKRSQSFGFQRNNENTSDSHWIPCAP